MDTTASNSVEGEEIACDVTMKIALIGDSSVGKTCLLNRYIQGTFSSEFYTTIGIDYRTKVETLDNKVCRLEIWDTAGQERFRAITKSYLRDVAGVLLVFDITNRASFANITTWLKQIEDSGVSDTVCVLVGTHSDMQDKRQVSDDEILETASTLKYKYFITSALNGSNVNEVFQEMGRQILNKSSNDDNKISTSASVDLSKSTKEKNSCAC